MTPIQVALARLRLAEAAVMRRMPPERRKAQVETQYRRRHTD